jgi:hypothetical protein
VGEVNCEPIDSVGEKSSEQGLEKENVKVSWET